MGILNATPDSFYKSAGKNNQDDYLATAEKMVRDGAAILDLGGVSSRPGAGFVSEQEEADRVLPVIEIIHKSFPEVWISVDTSRSFIAEQAVAVGASIINDISSGTFDTNMLETVARLRVPFIAMHMQGTPADMQVAPQYVDVVEEVLDFLRKVLDDCTVAGITDVIADPGFGFGKTVVHNFALLNNFSLFRILGKPLLAGISRKSMVCKPLGVSPANALNGTTALHMFALQQGASILRVHDVKEAAETIKLFQELKG